MEYVIIHEQFEINKKINPENLIDEAVSGGLMNGNYDAIKSFKSFDEAAQELQKYSCKYHKEESFCSWFWKLDAYYIVGIDEDDNMDDSFEFAKMEDIVIKYTYNIYSEDWKLVYESDDKFDTVDDLKAYMEDIEEENYIIYSVDEDYNYTEIEQVRNNY